MEAEPKIVDVRAGMTISELFNRPLVDLGEAAGPEFAGIFSPVYESAEINRFMSDYYKSPEKALAQSRKMDMTDGYRDLLQEALRLLKAGDTPGPCRILDVGCGFGSTTLPLLELFPQAHVVAIELSLSMLSILGDKLRERGQRQRCTLMQLNAEELDFRPDSFDLVVGSAILHHLFSPDKVCAECSRILKPGGTAIFFEPFENGYAVMGLIYREIWARNRLRIVGRLSREQAGYFWGACWCWKEMRSTAKDTPFFVGRDDKWLFTEHYFQELCERYGFDSCTVFPTVRTDRPFETLAKVHFKGNGITNLPDWVWRTIERYEDSFSSDMKMSLFTEGGIILKKKA